MSRLLYFDCSFGISGDMTVAALLDLGADYTKVQHALASLKVAGFTTHVSRVLKNGLDACDFDVVLDSEHANHDHDMEYLHGEHEHHHDHEHEHHHDHEHHHHEHEHHHHDHVHSDAEHSHQPQEHHHPHEHRGIKEIEAILVEAALTENARDIALKIFRIIAAAEAKAHGVPVDQVHFHEVGAVDSIVDIVSVAVCLDDLDADGVIIRELVDGHGTIRCQHGIIPVPVPAVANIVAAEQLPLTISDVAGELVTPTGAAIAAAIRTADKLPQQFTVQKIGWGAGKRNYTVPSLLRVLLIETVAPQPQETIVKLETNLDDCSGEAMGYCLERLLEAGAKDAFYQPIYMKKNRPAYMLTVLCTSDLVAELEAIIFRETTTIGIRRAVMERTVLPRRTMHLQTPIGEAAIKVCDINGTPRFYPEHESVKQICQATGKSYQSVFRTLQQEAAKIF